MNRWLLILTLVSDLIILADFLSLIVMGRSLGLVLDNPDKPLFGLAVSYVLGLDVSAVFLWGLCLMVLVIGFVIFWRCSTSLRRLAA